MYNINEHNKDTDEVKCISEVIQQPRSPDSKSSVACWWEQCICLRIWSYVLVGKRTAVWGVVFHFHRRINSAPVTHLYKYQDRYTQLFGKNEPKMKFKLVFSVTYQICQTMLFFLNLFIITEVTPLSCSSLTPALFENKGLFRRECHSVVLCSDCYAAHVFVCVQMWDRVTRGTADKRVVWLRFISADAGFVTLDWPSLFPFHPLSVSHLSYLQLMVKTKANLFF